MEVILVQLLLNIRHVSVSSQSLFALDLIIKVIFVDLHSSCPVVAPLLLELRVKDAITLSLLRVIDLLRHVKSALLSSVSIHLLQQLLLMLVSDSSLIVLGDLGALVLRCLRVVDSIDLILLSL